MRVYKEIESNYDYIENIFTPTELVELKAREKALLERNEKGYYCCKVKHPKLYNDMTLVYNAYNTISMLKQLCHA